MSTEDNEMASRISRLQPFIPALESIITTFTASKSTFHRVATLDSSSAWPGLSTASSSTYHRPSRHSHQQGSNDQKAIVVLDASFNPPSKAHAALALAAISRCKEPSRLLLLLGTRNADKHAQTPATHAQRLAMLILFATDLRDALGQQQQQQPQHEHEHEHDENNDVSSAKSKKHTPVDIGLASIPYMADKAHAIETEQPSTYAVDARQVHVMGYDTIVRVLAPRYYSDFKPPLSALQPLFGRGHEALVVLRPEAGHTVEQQRAEVTELVGGKLEVDGFKDEWRDLVQTLESQDAADISSTKVRKAACEQNYNVVDDMCTPTVAAWIQRQALYNDSE